MTRVMRGTLCVSLLSLATAVQGAEYELHPSIAVIEEFSDNVYEASTNRTSDYITRLLPGFAGKYKAPAANGEISYVLDYRRYAKESANNETTHALSAKGQLIPVETVLYLDLGEEYQRVSLDVTRDVTKESLYKNLADRNVAKVSPYLLLNPTERTKIKTGYRFIDTRYVNGLGIDKTDHVAFFEVANELSHRFSLTADYAYTRELADTDNFNQHNVLGGIRYEYADKSFFFAQVGNAWIDFDSGHRFSNFIWNAGITHVAGTITATVATGVLYNEDPLNNIVQEGFVSAVIEKVYPRGALKFSPYYSEYVLTETDTLLTKKYGATAQGHHEISSGFTVKLACLAEKYDEPLPEKATWRFQSDSSLSYLLAKQLTATLSHVYVKYYVSGIAAETWHGNRTMFEIKKIF